MKRESPEAALEFSALETETLIEMMLTQFEQIAKEFDDKDEYLDRIAFGLVIISADVKTRLRAASETAINEIRSLNMKLDKLQTQRPPKKG